MSQVSHSERRQLVEQTLADIRHILAAGVSRDSLAQATQQLEALALRPELFSRAEFPPPSSHEGEGASTRYRLNPDDGDDDIALYLNSINPGKSTWPHDHTTWAIIVALEGQEINRIYARTDDRSDPGQARLALARETIAQPGSPLAFLPDDIHSIAVTGEQPTLHFHLYGRPLETLTGRIGIHPDTGKIVNYNRNQMSPSVNVRL